MVKKGIVFVLGILFFLTGVGTQIIAISTCLIFKKLSVNSILLFFNLFSISEPSIGDWLFFSDFILSLFKSMPNTS